MSGDNESVKKAGSEALQRLLTVANGHTGQSVTVADFLLAWWNACECGKWNPVDLWGVDETIARDMLAVLGYIHAAQQYPDSVDVGQGDAFRRLVVRWRPGLAERDTIEAMSAGQEES